MNRKPPHQLAYEQIGKDAAAFTKMVADWPRMSSSEFLKHYPDYGYDGTDYICRRAEELAARLGEYAIAHESGMSREARAKQAA